MRSFVNAIRKLVGLAPRSNEALPGASSPEGAAFARESTQDRLHRLAEWALTGRLAAAELELYGWARESDCPADARVLLSSLLKRRGKHDDALAVLTITGVAKADSDAEILRMQACCLVTSELTESARQSLLALHHAHGHDARIGRWIRATQLPGTTESQSLPDAQVEHLAEELALRPDLLPSLVAAQRVSADAMSLLLLRQAVLRLAPNLREDDERMVMVCQALADLALLSDDADDARRWAYRGLRLRPYSASLALVLSRVEDDPAVGPSASEVLRKAYEANPNYPDVRAALIRTENARGDADVARRRLEQWLREQPDHPLARQVEREIAA